MGEPLGNLAPFKAMMSATAEPEVVPAPPLAKPAPKARRDKPKA